MRSLALVLSGVALIIAASAGNPALAQTEAALGTGLGAALGGLFGSQFGKGNGQLAATGVGIAVGGMVGNAIGHDIAEAQERSYPMESSVTYVQPSVAYNSTPNYVAPPAPPPPTYTDPEDGTYCRPYSQEIRIDGQLQETYGTACLQPDGSWRIVQ